jgi:hypothetical protein
MKDIITILDKLSVTAGAVLIAWLVMYYFPAEDFKEAAGIIQSIVTGMFGIATGMAYQKLKGD